MLPLRGFEQIASLAHVKHALILFALQILFKLRGIWWHSTYGRMPLDWAAGQMPANLNCLFWDLDINMLNGAGHSKQAQQK